MAKLIGRRQFFISDKPKTSSKTRRPKDFGIEHCLWVLRRHEEERDASRNDVDRREVYDTIGVRHDAAIYFGRSPTRAESASLSRACRIMEANGEAVIYPRTGKKTHLRLTALGWAKAKELRRNGGCSPREIDEAVRASSQHLRGQDEYRFCKAVYNSALSDPAATPEQVQFAASRYWFRWSEVDRVERLFREHLEQLPLEQVRAEVKRLKSGGRWEAPPMFTDGGTVPFPSTENKRKDKVFS